MKNAISWTAILASAVFLGACASINETGFTMRGGPAEAPPPTPVSAVAAVPANQSTYHYMVHIYPGLDEKFDPDPKLTLSEYNQITQLDYYCAKQTKKLAGMAKEMAKQGGTYGVFQGLFGALGYSLGFGSMISASDYLTAIGLTAIGGGLGSGKITFEAALNVAHGYCMTGMVYKADELEHRLRRIFIVPVYAGHAEFPSVSDAASPVYPTNTKESVPPLPR